LIQIYSAMMCLQSFFFSFSLLQHSKNWITNDHAFFSKIVLNLKCCRSVIGLFTVIFCRNLVKVTCMIYTCAICYWAYSVNYLKEWLVEISLNMEKLFKGKPFVIKMIVIPSHCSMKTMPTMCNVCLIHIHKLNSLLSLI